MTFKLLLFSSVISLILSYNNGVGRLPFMGWNTWCTDGTCGLDVCNDIEIKQFANAMITNGMYAAGYRYINLDDCWLACNRTSNGSLYAEPTRFPNGISSVINYVHNLKTPGEHLKFGLYTDVGTNVCSPGNRSGCLPPGCYGHYQQDANTLANWQVDFVKFDACNRPKNESFESLHQQFSKALNQTGRHILLELDGGYPLPAPPYPPKLSQAWKIVRDHHDEWNSTVEMFQYVAENQTYLSGPYGWAYADFLMTGGQGCPGGFNNEKYLHCPGQTDIEYTSEFSIYAISASPLIVATDIRNMTAIMKKVLLNSEIIEINQQDQTPAGNLLYYYDCKGNATACQVWSRKLNETNSIAIVLLNIDEEVHNITAEFDKLEMGWSNTTKVNVRDLWEHEDIGTFTGYFEAQVVPHGNFFGKLTLAT